MTNLNILEELRTKEEVLNYFKQLGKNITEEELEALKQSYSKVQENDDVLTMQQLDDVAGGNFIFILDRAGNVLARTHKNAIRPFPSKPEFEYDAPYCKTVTCCERAGDPICDGAEFKSQTPKGTPTRINIVGSDHEKSLVGKIRILDSTSPTGWRELADFTEGMTNGQFDETLDRNWNEIEQIYQDSDFITFIHTDGLLDGKGLREFSHRSDIDFVHMSDLNTHFSELGLEIPLHVFNAFLNRVKGQLYNRCKNVMCTEDDILLRDSLINYFGPVGERPSKRARK